MVLGEVSAFSITFYYYYYLIFCPVFGHLSSRKKERAALGQPVAIRKTGEDLGELFFEQIL